MKMFLSVPFFLIVRDHFSPLLIPIAHSMAPPGSLLPPIDPIQASSSPSGITSALY